MYQLRDYQARVKSELYDWFIKHPKGYPIIDACVGAGKSIIIADLCKDMISQAPDTRIVMCVASRELCEQNMQKLLAIWHDAPAGICSASLGETDTDSQIIFATIGTLARRVADLGRVDVMMIDECHNINTDNIGMYRKMIEYLQDTTSPRLAVIGFTGTPYRGNGVWLWQGKDPLFEGVASRVSMDELLERGYLAPLVVSKNTSAMIDTTSVRIQGGDYVVKDLSAVVEDADLIRSIVDDLFYQMDDRNKLLVYCVSVNHAYMVQQELQRISGLYPHVITGDTNKRERDDILTRYKLPKDDHNAINCLVSIGVLTTGFDAPATDCIVMLRPTRSPVLYVQIAGRGMRIADGKTDCLWLDYTDTTARLGAVNTIKGKNAGKANDRGKTATGEPCKYCPECGNKNPIFASRCQSCDAAFVSARVTAQVSQSEIIADTTPRWMSVNGIGYVRHTSKRSGKVSMRVDYYTDDHIEPISEYVCLEHDGFAKNMAKKWWDEHELSDMPNTVNDALHVVHTDNIMRSKRIECKLDGKFFKIINRELGQISEIYTRPPMSECNDGVPF